ncbi:unnamed protein product [Paramecium pentaurelia]|uniref:Uncharacterized protein n=1 Tax=Paramecium pentaurelia TaxID=43138 RepID=A0A8S1WBB2_9CILI|nr:unnamed protein product [Paramecium pentaurelia]
MNPYFEIASLFLPAKFTNYISITKSAYEIYNIASSKFRPEFASVKNAENYQTNDPTLYSQLFQGSFNLETIKRKSISLNQSCLKDIQDFLSNYHFPQQLNIIKICKEFYSEKFGCCIINLKMISNNLINYLQNEDIKQFNVEHLNQSIDELSLLFIEYIKGQFNQESIIEEFCENFEDISTTVYEYIIQAAKKKNKEIYNRLIKQIKQFYKQELNNLILDETCTIIKENKIPLFQVKNLIHNFLIQNHKYLHDELQNFYNFQLSNVVISRYAQKILDHQLFKIRSSLQIFMRHEKVYEEVQLKSQQLFYQYFQKKEFLLIKEKEFASQLFYLLLQVDVESKEILYILDILSQYTEITKIDSQQDVTQTLIKLRNTYKQEIEQANQFWKNVITEQQNLSLIFDLFILLNGTHFVNDQLLISQYQSVKKNILMNIINLMKEGFYGYFNCRLINNFENIIGDIRNQIIKQLEKQNQEIKLYVKIQEHHICIQLYDKDVSQQFSQEQFYKRNQIYHMINISQTENQINQIKILLSEIQKDYLRNITIPDRMQFEKRSPDLMQSSVITLFISGFTDSAVQNSILEGLKDQNLIVLNWNNPKEENNVKEKLMEAVKQMILKSPLEAVVSGLKAFTSAPFEQSQQEAKHVGRYLAHLLIDKKIFGDYQINIIAHSVGSTVMYEMMKELDNISNNTHTINNILILGGIVDTRKLQKRRWNCVQGRICNVFSKNDLVIKLMYNSFRLLDQFCGLNEVKQGYRKVENYNMSNLIKGHNDYGVHIQQILIQTDFLQYLRFLYE